MWNVRKALLALLRSSGGKAIEGGFEDNGRHYRAIFENVVEAVILLRADGRILMANQACTDLFGYTERELKTSNLGAVLDETDPRLGAALDHRSQRFRGTLPMKRKNGKPLEVEVSCAVIRKGQDAPLRAMFFRDVSKYKAHEAERERLLAQLEGERLWLRSVLQHVPLGLLLFDRSGAITFNAKAEELLGMKLSPSGGSAQYIDRIRFPDGRPVTACDLLSSRVLESGEVITEAEFLVEREDGTRSSCLGSAAPIRDSASNIIGGMTVLQDVSDRVRKDEAIRANERLLDAIFEVLPVGVSIADANGRIVRVNPAGVRIWSGARYVDPSQFGEYRGWWVDTGKLIEPEAWALARALKRGETSVGELIRIQCFDGTYKTIINSALPIYNGDGKLAGAVAVNEDITLLKEVEAGLKRAIATRDRVLRIVAHDLRSPLNVIKLQLHFLMQVHERRGDHVAALKIVQKQAISMDRLIADLLDITRIEQGTLFLERSPVRCEALLNEVVRAHESLARAACIALRCDIRPGTSDVYVDSGRIVQVLNNLIGNALKFTLPGGVVTLGAAPHGSETVIWVADTGIGIEPQLLEHVFDPLWQSSADRRGIGLGLAIAKAIVEAHGGRVWAESAVALGSTFFFTVPGGPGWERQAPAQR